MNESACPVIMMTCPPSQRDRDLMAALPDVADEYKERYGVARFLERLDWRSGAETGGGIRAYLHHLRADLWLPGSRFEDRHAGQGFCQSRFSISAEPAASKGVNCAAPTPGRRRHSVTCRSLSWAASLLRATDPDDPFVKLTVDTAEPVVRQKNDACTDYRWLRTKLSRSSNF